MKLFRNILDSLKSLLEGTGNSVYFSGQAMWIIGGEEDIYEPKQIVPANDHRFSETQPSLNGDTMGG